ncbi:ATP-binding protein [Carboxylicivirga caseinilyticus]|uniref:ATP-binding protein n=1 Tax=Carboxylicivirga caseinilyticus TaxID=3417572 RepID=UPI003D34A059|nr:ATP-binding protein [Marinilabiliaceae bacterium A049]
MLEITVLSGKGGTGKTTITAALASMVSPAIICDNDVDAADLFLILNPEIKQEGTFLSGQTATINTDLCSNCGICHSLCQFDAIELTNNEYQINPFNCEGCRLCERACPESAIETKPDNGHKWYESVTRFGSFVHAQMEPGEENSGKLVTFIRKKAKALAQAQNIKIILNDGPPGIGCPVIASLTGTNIVLLVIEPTLTGRHDSLRVIDLIKNFGIPAYAILNKSGINNDMEKIIMSDLKDQGIPLLGKVPYSILFRDAMKEQLNILEHAPESESAKAIQLIWNRLNKIKSESQLLTHQ